MSRRLNRRLPAGLVAELWSATYVLLGLRYSQAFAERLLRGVVSMKESVTYQAIIEEGEARGKAAGAATEARRLLIQLGKKRFGAPAPSEKNALKAIRELRQLEKLALRLDDVTSWQELLDTPISRRR
jgi:predicted transposase YdaD